MRQPRFRTAINSAFAILCIAGFLTNMSLGSVSHAVAADDWPTWPRKSTLPPGLTPNQDTDVFDSGKMEDVEVKKLGEGTFSKKIWWVAAGIAVAVGIAIAAGGSSGGEGGTTINPGHH